MNRTAVLNVVGLSRSLLGKHTPRLSSFAQRGKRGRIIPAFPAVTCTAQSNYLTGRPPAVHGIVGNGWYNKELAEVQFWKQPDPLVTAPKIWEEMRREDPSFTCAKLFWWYNMYSSVDYSITPRPMYPADGRKIFDVYTHPLPLRHEIKEDLGDFPFTTFWGPRSGIASSRWIADAARWFEKRFSPTLNLVYLPHLDYNLQRLGPNDPALAEDLEAIDEVVGRLIRFFDERGVRVVVLSEYGITEVDTPVHLNRIFRNQGWVAIKDELGLEHLDCGASKVFALADHQVAHIHVREPSLKPRVRDLLEKLPGIHEVLDRKELAERGIDHPRGGDFVAVAAPRAWFTYYYWHEDRLAPDFARCVDIHRKPGFDPVELFIDPKLRFPKAKIAGFLLRKKLGFRGLLDVIPLDATLVKGSHGRIPEEEDYHPILLSDAESVAIPETLASTDVCQVLKDILMK